LASVDDAGGVLTHPAAANTAAAAAAQRRAEKLKIGDRVFMKVSLSEKTAPQGQRSTDDYFSTILKFATP
jgi:2-keto-4-pentenoate hydratase